MLEVIHLTSEATNVEMEVETKEEPKTRSTQILYLAYPFCHQSYLSSYLVEPIEKLSSIDLHNPLK